MSKELKIHRNDMSPKDIKVVIVVFAWLDECTLCYTWTEVVEFSDEGSSKGQQS